MNRNKEELPLYKDFDIHHFLKFTYLFAKKGCLESHIENKFHNDPPQGFVKPQRYNPSKYYEVLKEVFDSIKRSKS